MKRTTNGQWAQRRGPRWRTRGDANNSVELQQRGRERQSNEHTEWHNTENKQTTQVAQRRGPGGVRSLQQREHQSNEKS